MKKTFYARKKFMSKNNFWTKKSKTALIIHNLCLIVYSYACKRHHLAFLAAHYHNKTSSKISV